MQAQFCGAASTTALLNWACSIKDKMKICKFCSKSFQDSKHPNKIYCSRKCYNSGNQPTKCKCMSCGIYFNLRGGKKDKGMFCSVKCKGNYFKKRVERKCENCGEKFTVIPSSEKRFCSIVCRIKGIINPQKKEVKNCVVCGNQYTEWSYRKSKCCSRTCAAKLGGATKKIGALYKKPNYGPKWEVVSREIRKRDNHTCQSCGSIMVKEMSFAVHHIKPLRSFNGDYTTANSFRNLILLCKSCHRKIESGSLPCPKPKL